MHLQTYFIFTRKSLIHAWPLKFIPSASCLKLKRQPWLPLLHLHLLCPVWWRTWCPMIVTTPRSSSIRPQSVLITRSVIYDRLSALVLSLILLSLSPLCSTITQSVSSLGKNLVGYGWVGSPQTSTCMTSTSTCLRSVLWLWQLETTRATYTTGEIQLINVSCLTIEMWAMWINTRSCSAEKLVVKNKCSV